MKVYRSKRAGREIHTTYDTLLSQWGIPVQEMDLSSPYGTTHVITAGDPAAEPMVLFHGVGDDSALMWYYNARALATRYRLYAVDTLGGPGKSVPGAGYAKGFDDAAWIDTILDGLGIDAAMLVGTSHGAYLAQYYGALRPHRVPRIICLAGSLPVGDESPMKTMMKIFFPEAMFPTERNTVRLLRKLMGTNTGPMLDNPTIMRHYRWLLRGFSPMSMQHHAIQGLTGAQIDLLRAKTLYLVGEEDLFQKLGGADVLKQYGMTQRRFAGVGHAINHEIAEEINRILLEV